MDYFEMFYIVKIEDTFRISDAVCIAFDVEDNKPSPKDATHVSRDAEGNDCPEMVIASNQSLPSLDIEWQEFLKNRNNKRELVKYMCEMLKGRKLSKRNQVSCYVKDPLILFMPFPN